MVQTDGLDWDPPARKMVKLTRQEKGVLLRKSFSFSLSQLCSVKWS